jgi:hypothetical protein
VLLHGETGIGKTATASEFARWYFLAGGVPGPVIYTSLSGPAAVAGGPGQLNTVAGGPGQLNTVAGGPGQLNTVAALAAQLITAVTEDPAAPRLTGTNRPGARSPQAIRQILRQMPLLWIWDDLELAAGPLDPPPPEWQELLSIAASVPDTRAKLLLISRHDQRTWLGDVPIRLGLPPLPDADRTLLIRAVAARQQVPLAGLGPSASALRTLGGNPATIIDLTERALRAGQVTSAGFEAWLGTG